MRYRLADLIKYLTMKTLRDYINLIEGSMQPKYYILAQGSDSTVVHTETGEMVYAGTVPECQQWIRSRDPQGRYSF
jgi:hypothetical protein